MANAIVAKIATAMMISSKVNPRWRLTGAIDIKFDLLRLFGAAARPLYCERNSIHTGESRSVVFFQFSGDAFLNQLHNSVTGVDIEFLRRIGKSGRGLHLGHSIGYNLPDTVFLRVEGTGVETVLHRATEREHAESKNRQAHQHFVKRKGDLTSDL